MISKKIGLLVAGALLMGSTASVAQAADASALSLAGAMQSSGEAAADEGGMSTTAIVAVGFLLVAFGVAIAANWNNHDNNNTPASP